MISAVLRTTFLHTMAGGVVILNYYGRHRSFSISREITIWLTIVPQKFIILDDSIRLVLDPNDQCTDNTIIDVLKTPRIWKALEQKEGLETWGSTLSRRKPIIRTSKNESFHRLNCDEACSRQCLPSYYPDLTCAHPIITCSVDAPADIQIQSTLKSIVGCSL